MEVTRYVQDIDIYEKSSSSFIADHPGVDIIINTVLSINVHDKLIELTGKLKVLSSRSAAEELFYLGGKIVGYHRLCICSGAVPQLILKDHPRIIGIRDTESLDDLRKRLESQRNIITVGNGGIALELVYALESCKVDWIVKDNYIGSAFFDAMAAQFMMPSLIHRLATTAVEPTAASNQVQASSTIICSDNQAISVEDEQPGSYAVGPDWDIRTGFSKTLKAAHGHEIGLIQVRNRALASVDFDGLYHRCI
jgi:hypothetical protein